MPIISCTMKDGSSGYKVENTSGCPHKTKEGALKQYIAIKSKQAMSSEDEEKKTVLFTSIENAHMHSYVPGNTSTEEVNGHKHIVLNGEIQEYEGHSHYFEIEY